MNVVLGLSLFFLSTNLFADVVVIRDLSFGKIAVLNNNTAQEYYIDYLGNSQQTSGLRVIEAGTPAQILLTNYPVNAQLFITTSVIQAQSSSQQPSLEHFTLDNLSTPSSLRIRTDGSALVTVGGRLRTSGSGNLNYTDTRYDINFQVIFNY